MGKYALWKAILEKFKEIEVLHLTQSGFLTIIY